MIKYRFALNSQNNLIDINDLERVGLTKTDKFFSVDFKQELIPHLGKIKEKHFAHKPNIEIFGSVETYLHALGKKIFYNEYSLCLEKNLAFYLKHSIQRLCNRLSKEFNITCKLKEKTIKYDSMSFS